MSAIDLAKWIGDGSEQSTLNVTADGNNEESTIAFASASRGTPFNIRLDANNTLLRADFYFEVSIIDITNESSLGVGFVSKDSFQPGWKTKGCFYNGNITNGSAGLIIGFGSSMKSGDVVGVYLKRTNGRSNIIFYHNGRCLGVGFSMYDESEIFYPCLHVSGETTVKLAMPQSTADRFPSIFERERNAPNCDDDPYSGDWAIEDVFAGPELGRLPLPPDIKFKVTLNKINSLQDDNNGKKKYHLFFKIGNSLRTSFSIAGKLESFDKIECFGPCMGTRMMPRPAFAKIEHFIQSAINSGGCQGNNGFNKISVDENGNLIITGPTGEIACSPYVETYEPVTSLS